VGKAKRRTVILKLDAVVLAIDSNFEPATLAAFNYRQANVYPLLKKAGFKIERCQGLLARRCYVAPQATQPNVVYITGVGHGTTDGTGDQYTGYQYEVIFKVAQYSPLESRRKIVHFLSCEAAIQLGPDFVHNGCRAFFSYDKPFTGPWLYANMFFDCDSEIDRGFAKGLTAAEVQKRAKARYSQRIAQLRAIGTDAANYAAGVLENNLNALRGPSDGPQWGDKRARL
jgi:hypothetical protein